MENRLHSYQLELLSWPFLFQFTFDKSLNNTTLYNIASSKSLILHFDSNQTTQLQTKKEQTTSGFLPWKKFQLFYTFRSNRLSPKLPSFCSSPPPPPPPPPTLPLAPLLRTPTGVSTQSQHPCQRSKEPSTKAFRNVSCVSLCVRSPPPFWSLRSVNTTNAVRIRRGRGDAFFSPPTGLRQEFCEQGSQPPSPR